MENSVFQNYQNERMQILSMVKNKDEIEKIIIRKLKKNMLNNKNKYFDINDLFKIDEIKKHFKFFAITGDRNIGKTTSFRNYIVNNIIPKNQEFMWLRNKDVEIKMLLPQEKQTFFQEKGWAVKITNGTIFESDDALKKKDTNRIIGHYKAINNIHNEKSIEYKNVFTIFYDEFNTQDNIKNKFSKLAQFITTIERQKKNFKVILAANYINQADPILLNLGLSQKKENKHKLLIFNWIAGSILWNIPKNWYTKFNQNNLLGKRISLTNFETYHKQYAGSFLNNNIKNIVNLESIILQKPIFNICWEKNIFTLFQWGKKQDKLLFCSNEIFGVASKVKNFVFTKKDKFNMNGAKILPQNKLKILIDYWNKEKLFVSNSVEYALIIEMFEKLYIEKNDIIDYIE